MTTQFQLSIATPRQLLSVPGWAPNFPLSLNNQRIHLTTAKLPVAIESLSTHRLILPMMPISKVATTIQSTCNANVVGNLSAPACSLARPYVEVLGRVGALDVDPALRFLRNGRGRIAFGYGPQSGRRFDDVARAGVTHILQWLVEQSLLDCGRMFGRRGSAIPFHATATKSL